MMLTYQLLDAHYAHYGLRGQPWIYALTYEGGKSFSQLSPEQQKALRSWRVKKDGPPPVSIDSPDGGKAKKPAAKKKGSKKASAKQGAKKKASAKKSGDASPPKAAPAASSRKKGDDWFDPKKVKQRGADAKKLAAKKKAESKAPEAPAPAPAKKKGLKPLRGESEQEYRSGLKSLSRAAFVGSKGARAKAAKQLSELGPLPLKHLLQNSSRAAKRKPDSLPLKRAVKIVKHAMRERDSRIARAERMGYADQRKPVLYRQQGAPAASEAPLPTKGEIAYQSRKNPDGTWAIFGVPIFVTHKHSTGAVVDRAWLERALGNQQRRYSSEGYLPPVHTGHTRLPDGRSNPNYGSAGFFRLTGVEDGTYEGKPCSILFADLMRVPDAVYQEIKSGNWPYTSPEIHNFESGEVDSLSLIKEVPYFRQRPICVYQAREGVNMYRADGGGMYTSMGSYAAASGGEGSTMKDKLLQAIALLSEYAESLPDEGGESADDAVQEEELANDIDDAADESLDADIDDAEDDGLGDDDDDDDEAPEIYNGNEPPKPSKPRGKPAEMYRDPTQAGINTAVQERLNKLEAYHAQRAKEGEQSKLVNDAHERIGHLGYPREVLATYAAKGADVLNAFVDGVEEAAIGTPPETYNGSASGGPITGRKDPEELKAYAANPAQLAQARELCAQHAGYKSSGGSMSLKDFLATNIAADDGSMTVTVHD